MELLCVIDCGQNFPPVPDNTLIRPKTPHIIITKASNYESGPLGRMEDGTVFLFCLYISGEKQRGKGIGTKLLNTVIADLRDRGFKAIETLARRGSANNPSGPIEL